MVANHVIVCLLLFVYNMLLYLHIMHHFTHRNKDHHGYAMVVHRDKLYRSDQRGAPGVTSWEVRRPSLWGPLAYLLPML